MNHKPMRIAVLDVEASGFGPESYPIEVGLAIIEGTDQPIRTWSALIKPTTAWREAGFWSARSQAVHGIPVEMIEREGQPVHEVAGRLNQLLSPVSFVKTDAPRYDQGWLDTLFAAAGEEQGFALSEYDILTGGDDEESYRAIAHQLDRSRVPHRAKDDALRLASALLEAHLGYPPQVEEIMS